MPKIGLEVHLQLKTEHKMFCRCPLPGAETPPNTLICPVCLGYPGTLPQLNREAIEKGMLLAKALGAKIQPRIHFDRKNYFYPDLPKNYQISQHRAILAEGGEVLVDYLSDDKKRSESFKVKLNHLHLEEDSAKLLHEGGSSGSLSGATLVDFNRAGVPLLEIVSEPMIHSSKEARLLAKELQRIARALGISEADMEQGELRMDANISLSQKTKGQKRGIKVEIKNLNSFVSLGKALDYEIKRQTELIKKGKKIIQETRGWDQKEERTYGQRTKEYSADYRYFPEPDLPEIILDHKPLTLSPLPSDLRRQALKRLAHPAKIYMLDDLGRLEEFLKRTAKLKKRGEIDQVASRLLAPGRGKGVYRALPAQTERVIEAVLAKNPQQLYNFKQGKVEVINFFIGEVLKGIKGADPRKVKAWLEKKLAS